MNCKGCGFLANKCLCARCVSVAANGYCSSGCEIGYKMVKEWELEHERKANA